MTTLRVCSIALFMAAACVDAEPGSELGTEEAALTAPEGQGSDFQGSDFQGSDFQGSDFQGSDFQGSDFQGATLGGVAVASGTALVQDRALSVWRVLRTFPIRHEQRLPDRTCLWDSARTTLYSCTTVDLRTQPSPLAGVSFQANFVRSDGSTFTGRIRIGAGSSSIGAVAVEGKPAMHPLVAHAELVLPGGPPRQSCTRVSPGQNGCENPNGCRINCDLFTYDLDLIDADGSVFNFCPAGQRAIAVPGTYSANGERAANGSQFTFACMGGTIAKCTRWGYRSFGVSRKNTGTTAYPLADYHQSCVRAAAADYCANGHSWTKNGTLVDVWDYDTYNVDGNTDNDVGFVPRMKNILGNAFLVESAFDKYGGQQLERMRYDEMRGPTGTGGVEDPEVGCPERFINGGIAIYGDRAWKLRDVNVVPWDTNSMVWIDTTASCAHSEHTVGKWLDSGCSVCTMEVASYCSDRFDPRGWDEDCVAAAEACPGGNYEMTERSECEVGEKLDKYGTGCTLRVCLDDPSCCNTYWSSACVTAANLTCKGGQENAMQFLGFCGETLLLPPINGG